MKDYLEYVFSLGYTQYKGNSIAVGSQTAEYIKKISQEIAYVAESQNLSVKYSIGQGRWASVPWIRVYDMVRAPSAQSGIYIVYLFSESGQSVFLTLNQGVTKATETQLTKNKKDFQSKINSRHFNSNDGIINGIGEYGASTIFYKEYKRSQLPSDAEMKNDLEVMMDIYKESLNYKPVTVPSPIQSAMPESLNISSSHNHSLTNFTECKENSFFQTIFFGAPGTGKSYKIGYNLFKDKDGKLLGKGLKEVSPNRKFRTTFHPDYDYAQFVGAYKPTMNGGKIEYSFVPQVFAKAYATAWKLLLSDAAEKDVYLVIEEINRGNCAQIFGDLFQLLDRKQGHSEYPIDVDSDFAKWLNTDSKFGLGYVWNEYRRKINEWSENGLDGRDDVFCKVALPPNLNILATMNTSDQSLFPMDSAFKRRFDWEYVPISFDGKDAANFQIEIDASLYSWQKFVEAVNEKILDLTESEDKQLGEFFIKPDKKDENNQLLVISEERFLGKVMFYLWNEVCKDEHKNRSFFRTKDDGYFTFQDLYKPEKKDLLNRFMAEFGKNST